ncbi:MAG: TerB family tellurite resistance protein [Robiginitomaculum sp.]|nr:TerB family tellurite resistance protein [Robiginitomaculum sp.]
MHILGIIIAVATAIFWVSRAARGAKDVMDVANTLRNMPRRMRFKNKAGKRGLDLIDNPMEAATILMVSVAKLSDYAATHDGLISGASTGRIIDILKTYMKISAVEADELLTQMRWTVKGLAQPDTALASMTTVLSAKIRRAEADDLSDMLSKISQADGKPNPEQQAFINRVRERLGLEA